MQVQIVVFITFITVNVILLLCNGEPELIWSDEFDGQSIDRTKWAYYTGKAPNNELEQYTNRTENVFVENGNLVLKAIKEIYNGHNFTSGEIYSQYKGDFLYKTVKVRAKLPYGRGVWPAIWMLPTYYKHGPGIASGEIDILELLGDKPNKMYSTCHYGKTWTDRDSKSSNYSLPHGDFSDDFHVFSMKWSPDLIRIFVDDVQIINFRPSDVPKKYTYPFDDYFYIILNVAVGGNWPGSPDASTVFPQVMLIDYVRVYK
uniref:GH16 domain-containing protein n=1 Tax=Strigamia maritima TaxID=126957 RepID=T1JF06_STRMM